MTIIVTYKLNTVLYELINLVGGGLEEGLIHGL